MSSTLEMTAEFIGCARCRTSATTFVRRGAGAQTALTDTWYPPRGWAGTERDGHRPVMLVSLNPGKPLPEEVGEWRVFGLVEGCCNRVEPDTHLTHARTILKRCTKSYVAPGEGRDYIFHRRSVALARACLWLLDLPHENWLDLCWFTDVFKCSTRKESPPDIPRGAFAACRPWMDQELERFQPRVVLALGRRVHTELGSLPQVIYFPHPSPANNGAWQTLADDSHAERFAAIAAIARPQGLSPTEAQAFRTFLVRLGV